MTCKVISNRMKGVLCGAQFCAVAVSGGAHGIQNYLFYVVLNLANLILVSGGNGQVVAIAQRSNDTSCPDRDHLSSV